MKKKLLSIFAIMALSVFCMTACGKDAEPEKETETKVEESKKDTSDEDKEISSGTEKPSKEDGETPEIKDPSQDEKPETDKEPLSKIDGNDEADAQNDQDDKPVASEAFDLSNPDFGVINGKPASDWTPSDVILTSGSVLDDGYWFLLYTSDNKNALMLEGTDGASDSFITSSGEAVDGIDYYCYSRPDAVDMNADEPHVISWRGVYCGDSSEAIIAAYGPADIDVQPLTDQEFNDICNGVYDDDPVMLGRQYVDYHTCAYRYGDAYLVFEFDQNDTLCRVYVNDPKKNETMSKMDV